MKITFRASSAEPEPLGESLFTAYLPAVVQRWLPWLACMASGVMLGLSFPSWGYATLAFGALVPLIYAVSKATPKKSAGMGWVCGTAYFLVSLSWLLQTTRTVEPLVYKMGCVVGYVLLSLICGLFVVPSSLMITACIKRWGVMEVWKNARTMGGVTVVWVGAEYVRSFLFTGFPWNFLGISQYENLTLIQVADWGGAYVVSALLVFLNVAIGVTLMQYSHGKRMQRYRPHVELMMGIIPIALAAAYGLKLLYHQPELVDTVNVALVQPNISQSEKWDEAHTDKIYERLERLTLAAHAKAPDLVVWPETALPDFLRYSAKSTALVQQLVAKGVPLLVGTMDMQMVEGKRQFYNSSILVGVDGAQLAKYDKQHLVPFGEYIPLPMIRKYTPISQDLTAGTESSLFRLPYMSPFSTLICFEDIVAPLASKAVRDGARWLINQTNDGWFDPSGQSEQHVAHAVFQCVENRVPMARCGNTGVSGGIDAYGHIQRELGAMEEGVMMVKVFPRPMGMPKTFYTRRGDVFAQSCLGVALLSGVLFRFGKKKKK